MMSRRGLLIIALAGLVGCDGSTDESLVTNPAERVGIIVTGWGTVKGNSPDYNARLYQRAFIGERATAPDQPCTDLFLGEWPYRTELGQVPYAVVFPVEGFERLWDGYGVYRQEADGRYVSVLDPGLVLTAADVEGVRVIPAREMPFGGRAFFFDPDPRDGTDHLAGYYKIMQPNGLHDAFEQATLSAMRRDALMGYVDMPPTKYAVQQFLEDYLVDYIAVRFGDRAEVRFGYYADIPGVTEMLEDVAVGYARDGFDKLLVARETTDHNLYANVTWDRNHTLRGLCQAGFRVGEGGIRLEHVRQVGRTPEYNEMLVRNLKRHFERIEPGSEVSIIYATHGYQWPGNNPDSGALSQGAQPVKYVYHENAFLNFSSFKQYALTAFDASRGGRYRLNFAKSGGQGSAESRSNTLIGYAHIYEPLIGIKGDPLKYQTVRNVLETAIREDGRTEIIIVLSHWYKNSNNTAVEIRELNTLPLNTNEEIAAGEFSITWCERYTAPGEFDQYRPAAGESCREGDARVQVTEAFNDVAEEFLVGYAARIRGGVERFGVFPDLELQILAEGPVTMVDGGRVEVTTGELAGARLVVRPDPQPGVPESNEWKDAFKPANHRYANTADDALRPINEYRAIDDYLDGAKDDFTAYIGLQGLAGPGRPLPQHPRACSETVYFGPYRTLFNAPATVTLPFGATCLQEGAHLGAFIYNEVTGAYDPVYPVPAGAPILIDRENGLATFDVQVLGNFVLAVE